MNKVILIGNLTRDPETALLNNGEMMKSRFTLAINTSKDDVDFIDCVAWNRQAAVIDNYTAKGSKIGVVGSIKKDSYQNKEDKTVHTTYVLVENVELLSKVPTPDEDVKETKEEPKKPKFTKKGE